MSTAEPEAAPVAPKKSKTKLTVIIAALSLLLGGGGGAAYFAFKAKAQAAADAEEGEAESHASAKSKGTPTYVPLDAFVVNLADKEADRYAQIGITLEVDDPKVAEDMKTYMPAVRNGILMVLAHKTSDDLLERTGKEQLAAEVMLAAARAVGIPLGDGPPAKGPTKERANARAKVESDAPEDDADAAKPAQGKPAKKAARNPITQVLFSNFIIQ